MKHLKRYLSLALALVLVLSCVYLRPLEAEAAASDYISTSYASNLSVKTNKTTALKTEPNNASAPKYTLPVDTMLTVQALHKNTAGTFYYEVLFYNMVLYVEAANCTMVDHLTGDVVMTGAHSPASLAIGNGFYVKGNITSKKNMIGKLTAGMYKNQHLSLDPVISSSDTVNGKSYSLASSTLDNNLLFSNTPAGVYDYAVIAEAISYYIDDNGSLATSSQNVVLERQQCVVTDWRNPNKSTGYGIDVSVWNGDINWSKVKTQVDFVILRIGFSETLDNRFLEYAENCETYDIPYGVYHYSYALSSSEAAAEAKWVLNALKTYNYNPDLPIFFDMEDGTQASLGTSAKEAICRGFCDTIWEGGREPGFYGFTRWFSSSFISTYLNSMPVWIAQIDGFSSNGTATHDGGTWLWQFSWEGSFSGISGDVDCNYCYANWPGIDSSTDTPSDTTYLADCTAYPAHFSGKTTASVNMRQYPSTSYTSMGIIASGTTLEVTGLYKNSSGGYWYQVTSAGTTGYIDAGYITPVEYLYNDLAVISPTMASNLNVGSGYYITGDMVSRYNNIHTACAKVYTGEDTQVEPVIQSSYTCNSTSYDLTSSEVDANLIFSDLSAGYYTYEISADVRNYYVSGGTLKYETENVVVWTAPFTVGNATITPPANLVCNHTLVTDPAVAPGCTTTGLTAGSHCSKCGLVMTEQEEVPATGHKYNYKQISNATCKDYASYTFTCSGCGISSSYTADQMTGQWIELNLVNADPNLFTTQTQYRYSDYQTTTSTSSSLAGYTQTGSSWVQSSTGSVQYVTSWPSGFKTSHSDYTKYNNTKVTAGETATTKTTVESNEHIGYLWYHWCDTSVTSSWAYQTGVYNTFHTYFGTTAPSNYPCDTSDMSYGTFDSSCSNAGYWFPIDVYEQHYTQYQKQYTYERWSDFSAWSTTAVTATATRRVETRTVFKLKEASLGAHNYVSGKCTVCGAADPNHNPDYYLFGSINGADYGCEGDYNTLGIYKFVDGKLTVTFETDSYVGVKNGNNLDWYLTNGWLGTETTSATLYNANTLSNADKLYVPGGVEVTFTLVDNGDDTLNLSYTYVIPVAKPKLAPKYPTLSFEDEVFINVYFTVSELGDRTAADMGLLTWSTARTGGTIADAEAIIPGATYNSSTGMYCVRTEGIAAKKLGDSVYFKIYIKLADGSYLYTTLLNYSPKAYANSALNGSNAKQKALVVAMLNYGAAAQTYFGYKPYNLMNSTLTSAQTGLVQSYNSGMIASVVKPATGKVGIFTNSGGFSKRYPTVSFEGAFSINYYFAPSNAPDGKLKLYYWDQATYNSVATLTPGNATGSMIMTANENGEYHGIVDGIAAKDLGGTVYVAAGYTSGGVTYCTGVLAYSIGSYCVSQAAGGSSMKSFAAATAVYSYYAKQYFTA